MSQHGSSAAGGALSGAASGAVIGSAVPVIGTAVGAIAGGVIGGVAGWFSGKSQSDAIDKATKGQEELGRLQLEWQKELAAEGREEREIFREIRQRSAKFIEQNIGKDQTPQQQARIRRLMSADPATGARRLIELDVMREPGTSPLFRTSLRRGTEALAGEYAALGLVSGPGGSTAFGKATGEMTEGLLARDIEATRAARFGLEGLQARDREQQWGREFSLEGLQYRDIQSDWGRRFSLAGLGPPSTTAATATNALQLYGGTQANIANLGLAQGQLQAQSYQDLIGLAGSIASRYKAPASGYSTPGGTPSSGYSLGSTPAANRLNVNPNYM